MSDPTTEVNFSRRMVALGTEFTSKLGDRWSMVTPQSESLSPVFGTKWTFVPPLGEIVWELPEELASTVPFSAHVCQTPDRRQIGYVRIPHYTPDEKAVDVFEEIIARFERTTTAMVLDQVNNPGGSMFYMYALLSTLADRRLELPKHQIRISDDELAVAADTVELAEAGVKVPAEERPSPELVAYSRCVLSEAEAGRGRSIDGEPTHPMYLGGVTEILPAKNHYTKKIVVLINALTISAGEFLAAILQDNRRATLFGEHTAGGGGCAKRFSDPALERAGIQSLLLRWTLAWRTNGTLIEGVGVQPDVSYTETIDDLQWGYKGYRQALMATIDAAGDAHAR
jgi:hypothetical protein